MQLPEVVRVSFSPLVIVALVLSMPLTLWGLIASIDDPHPMVKAGIAGAALGCAVGLGLLLLVVGPLIALLHADDFVDFNYADIEDDERPLARTAVRLIAFTLMFVVPFGVGLVMEWMWMWLTSVAIMIVLVARVVIVQRRLGRSPV